MAAKFQNPPVQLTTSILLLLIVCSAVTVHAQTASIDFSAERNYVNQNGSNTLLPFVVVVNNPTASPLNDAQFVITMPAAVNLGNVDKQCTESANSSGRALSCSLPTIKAHSSRLVDFFIDGPNSIGAGPSFTLSLNSSNINVLQPTAFEASLADGNTRIRGSNLTVHLRRDISFDVNQNQVPDIDEAIMGLPLGTPVDQLQARKAVIDVLFLYSPIAAQYLDGKLESRIAQFLTATNQTFRDNDVAIKFNGVGLAQVPYTVTNNTLTNTLNTIQANSDPAFADLDQFVTSSGGDLVVFLHALAPGTDPLCGYASLNGLGRQGDFQSQYHKGKLITVVNIGPDCLGLPDLAPAFAANMGIVPTRQEFPDGGTFSYSAGYGVTDVFTTIAVRLGSVAYGQAEDLNRFSNSEGFCMSLLCGVDRNDIAQGADAVHSMNKTRHVVSALTKSVFPVDPDAIVDKPTVPGNASYDIEVTQAATETAALRNEFTEIEVTVTNTASVTLYNLDLSIIDLSAGLPSQEAQVYENSTQMCRIFGPGLTTAGITVASAQQKAGRLSCFVEAISAGESFSFRYRVLVDDTPPQLNGAGYYQQMVTVNTLPQVESGVCIPVFNNFVEASFGSAVCDSVQIAIPGIAPHLPVDLNALPTVTGATINLPFLRLFDGSLISAQFKVSFAAQLELLLVSYTDLDSNLAPSFEATFDAADLLHISSLQVGTNFYDVQATAVPNSDPVRFANLVITTLGP